MSGIHLSTPLSWKETSLDFKLFFAYHISMILTSVVASRSSFAVLTAFALAVLAILSVVSIANRRKRNWRWPGAKAKDVLRAVAVLALGLFLVGSALPSVSMKTPGLFPWFGACAGLILFGMLSMLNVVTTSEAEFAAQCTDQPVPRDKPSEPYEARWKKVARGAFISYALMIWIGGVTAAWHHGFVVRGSSKAPTPTQTEAYVEHGQTMYISREQKRTMSRLHLFMFPGILSVFVLAGLTHVVLLKLGTKDPPVAG